MAFSPLGSSYHVVVSVYIDVSLYSQQNALFPCIAYDYSCADWDGIHDHFRDVPWEDIFKLSAYAAVIEFCDLVQIGLDVYIPDQNYQVMPHSSPWLLAAFVAVQVHRNLFFLFTKKMNLLNLK